MIKNFRVKSIFSGILLAVTFYGITVTSFVTRENITNTQWESFLTNYHYHGINYTAKLANLTNTIQNRNNKSEEQEMFWNEIFNTSTNGTKRILNIINELQCNGSSFSTSSRVTNTGMVIKLEALLDGHGGTEKTAEYSKFVLQCKADFPIQWTLFGPFSIFRKTVLRYSQKYIKKSKNWSYSLLPIHNIMELERALQFVQKFKKVGRFSSVTISCPHYKNSSINEYVDVFFDGDTLFLKNELKTAQKIGLMNSKVIPCVVDRVLTGLTLVVTDPTSAVNLYTFDGLGAKQKVAATTGYTFNPTIGFIFPYLVQGDFSCEYENESIDYKMEIKKTGYNFQPRINKIYGAINDRVSLNCSNVGEKNSNLHFLEDDIFDIAKNEGFITTTSSNVSTSISWEMLGLDFRAVGFTGNVSSVEDNGNTVTSWEIKLANSPELMLDNIKRTMRCEQRFVEMGMQLSTIECINPPDCEMIQNCIASKQRRCTVGRQIQEGNSTISSSNGYSTEIPYPHQNGFAQCNTPGGEYVKRWIFYTTLDDLKKDIAAQAEVSELLRMDQVSSVLYANGTSTFVCRAVSFLFVGQLMFQVEFENGSRTWIEFVPNFGVGCTNRWNSSFRIQTSFADIIKRHSGSMYGTNTSSEVVLSLTTDMIAVRCLASWWNSSDLLVTEQRFKTLYKLAPISNIPRANLRVVLVKDGPTKKLHCMVTAQPSADYLWFRAGKVVESSSDILITSGKSSESFLEFTNVHNDLKGDWICLATNEFGVANITFTIEDVITTSDNAVTIIIVVIILLPVMTALIFAYLFWHFGLRQQIRNLTENELDEFFQGVPGLSKHQLDDPANIELVPYNKDFEIDANDLEFESMKILGTGAYGTVIKGRRRSTNADVAVKIAKASSNVEIFKGLLIEVKIMIYMGEHENLVAFIGACTSNIRTGRIHIVLEICERGDLTSILRNCKPSFVNLVNENQDFNTHLISVTEKNDVRQRISTLDLLRWAAEIGHGMEYLALKGIVHADLATRNILINTDWTAKICDFGLSRKLYENINYVKKTKCPLPWRSMSPEALKALTFSTKSDVWSYGITTWELFTLGDTPFANETWNKEFTARLTDGMRPGKPKFANAQIYFQMIACWENDPDLRPEFRTLRKYFAELFGQQNQIYSANCDKALTEQHVEEILYTNCESKSGVSTVYEN